MNKAQTIVIEKKRFTILPEIEYLSILQDIADLKKVLKRKTETGVEAKQFFKNLEKTSKSKINNVLHSHH